ncbi:hypothetical protein ACFQX9_23480 [Bradyrhizobium sp. GCM10028915]
MHTAVELEAICRELAEAATDPVERAALLEIAENYGKNAAN